jgi:putative ATP-binding cassette transporter
LIYVLPQLVVGLDQTIVKIAAATLFIIGPIGTVVNVLPSVEQAESGLRALNALEQRLDSVAVGQKVEESATHFDSFQSLTVQNALFQYPGEEGFLCGPWSLSARAGEVVFLVGGNGSGKSTVLKLLTGLYPLASGLIEVNGARLGPADTPALGELFTTVFTDFHLFDQLYGLEEVDPEAVRALLERMGLRDKVSFAEGRFSTLSLSTGQRKRLALVVALLEDKPIYIFDEWAADQERAFRDEFYHHILKELAARKKLVIAVTHDERYLHLADRVITFEAGRIISDRREGAPA